MPCGGSTLGAGPGPRRPPCGGTRIHPWFDGQRAATALASEGVQAALADVVRRAAARRARRAGHRRDAVAPRPGGGVRPGRRADRGRPAGVPPPARADRRHGGGGGPARDPVARPAARRAGHAHPVLGGRDLRAGALDRGAGRPGRGALHRGAGARGLRLRRQPQPQLVGRRVRLDADRAALRRRPDRAPAGRPEAAARGPAGARAPRGRPRRAGPHRPRAARRDRALGERHGRADRGRAGPRASRPRPRRGGAGRRRRRWPRRGGCYT